ncbi:uncharacterized protein LOC111088514 [Limulus polyphemus]|uniref:Uncharacterized protein LOC111088514 n=1 Tax=Limulus polyphemus TaxID=6850 RepID=A0ABM1TFE6_LIMPO|nr:uncharacterized protein LOC111088514 [Limulus polyphemus]
MYPRPCQMTPGSFRLIPGTSTLYDNRFRHLQKRHKESFLGLNAIFLPDANPVGVVYRSSLPATPLCTPLHEGPQFSERVLRERLCKTPSPWKCKFFEPHHSSVGLNTLEDNWGDVALKGDCVNRVTSLAGFKKFAQHAKNKIEERTDKNLGHISHQSKRETITKENQPITLSLNKRVFVGNISYRVSRKELWNHFSQFGKVVHCVIVQDHIKKRPKGLVNQTCTSGRNVK